MGEDAAHLRSLVAWERETVMDHLTEVLMMAMLGVGENSCVAVTIARSLEPTSTPRMTAVMNLPLLLQKGPHLSWYQEPC